MTESKKTPELRFPGFTEPWEEKKLGEIGKIIIGLTYSPKDTVGSWKNAYLVLRSSNIQNNILDLEDVVYVNKKISSNLEIKKNDILICSRNGSRRLIGKNIIIKNYIPSTTFGAFMMVFRSDRNKFLINILRTDNYKRQIYRNLGATINQITSGEMKKMKFNIPSLAEQEKIGSFFSSLDKKLDLQKDRLEELKSYKKGMMQRIFDQEIRFKDENGRNYPDWQEKKLGESIYEVDKKKVVKPWEIELLTVRLHLNGVVASGKYPNKTLRGRPYYKRNKGELLIGRQNMHNGGFGFVDDFSHGLIASNAISSYLFYENTNPLFCYYQLSNKDYYRKIDLLIGGTGQKEISRKELEKLKINVPSLAEQEKIASFLSALDRKIELEEEKLRSYEEFKKGLMQRMFV